MALPSSGPISFGDVRTELGLSGEISSSTINTYRNGVASTATKSMSELREYSYQHQERAKLLAIDGAPEDFFGASVSISGDGNTVIVGADKNDSLGNADSSGAAYIFTRSGSSWSQYKLIPPDIYLNDRFGSDVSISGDGNTAIVGAYRDDDMGEDSGSAYIFVRNDPSWYVQYKLIAAADGAANDWFGSSVSISDDGNTVIVGAYRDDDKGNLSGSAYIFTRSGSSWPQQAKLLANDGAETDFFGQAVSISGDGNTVIVGARYEDQRAENSGAAYIFVRNGENWSQQAKLLALIDSDSFRPDGANDWFGQAVSISGDGNTVIVGAPNSNVTNYGSGSAYIFTRSGSSWSQTARLLDTDYSYDSGFGSSVSISDDGNTVIVGANSDNNSAGNTGSAYTFVRRTDENTNGTIWVQQTKLLANDGASIDQFGWSSSISGDGNTVIVGAYNDDDKGNNSGSAYIFERLFL